jgi:predicted nucleic acid-binding Zn ribbon protein
MAIYSFLCVDPECAAVSDRNVPMAQRNEVQVCEECGGPAERTIDYTSQSVVWKTTGGTRTFDSKRYPKLPAMNTGHEDLTLGKLGLSESDGKALGI